MRTTVPGRLRALRALLLLLAPLALLASAVPAAFAAAGTISSPGSPLTSITISPDLNCAVDHAGDSAGEFYGSTACGTLIAVNATLLGPAYIPAGSSASPRITWTPVSQNGPTGTGTPADPFKIVTVVTGAGAIKVTETDTYVAGTEQYHTDVLVQNTSGVAVTGIVYRAGDCYLQDSDVGRGIVKPAQGVVACEAKVGSTNPNRVEEWVPTTPGSSFFENNFNTVWARIGSQQPFDNTCTCDQELDNGAGLSWPVSLANAQSTTFSHDTVFSPAGNRVTLTKTADAPLAGPGGDDGYTVTASNTTADVVTLNSITEHLAAGFSYVAGSSTGVTSANPTQSGQDLTWTGPFSVPAAASVSVHFRVKVAGTVGIYTDDADADAAGSTIVSPTGQTAPVVVATPPTITGNPYTTQTLTCNGGGWPPGEAAPRTYQWNRNGAPIPAANGTTYVPGPADIGAVITCTENVTYPNGTFSLTSAGVTIIGPPLDTVPPTITGTPQLGATLTCHTGTWQNNPTGYTYVWLRNGRPIPGATGPTYRPTAPDAGASITCQVTAINLGGSGVATSAGVRVVAATPAPGPPDTTVVKGPHGTFRIQVVYQVRTACSNPCRASAVILTRSGQRVFSMPLVARLPGDGKVTLGTRTGLKLPVGKKIRFYITIKKAALLRTPFVTQGGFRVAETRLKVTLQARKGAQLTVRDGHIKVSIARIKSGALPGLKGIL